MDTLLTNLLLGSASAVKSRAGYAHSSSLPMRAFSSWTFQVCGMVPSPRICEPFIKTSDNCFPCIRIIGERLQLQSPKSTAHKTFRQTQASWVRQLRFNCPGSPSQAFSSCSLDTARSANPPPWYLRLQFPPAGQPGIGSLPAQVSLGSIHHSKGH